MAVTWKKLAYEDDVVTKAIFTASGDILYANGVGTVTVLPKGTDTNVLTLSGGIPSWAAAGAPGAHKDTHDPEDGADPLDTAAPGELAGVQASAIGTSHSLARADHAHQIQESMADNHLVTVNGTPVENDMARFTATGGLDGLTYAELAALMALDDIGAPDAAVDFAGQEITNPVIHQVADNTALLLLTPVVGKIAMQVDTLAAYICTASV